MFYRIELPLGFASWLYNLIKHFRSFIKHYFKIKCVANQICPLNLSYVLLFFLDSKAAYGLAVIDFSAQTRPSLYVTVMLVLIGMRSSRNETSPAPIKGTVLNALLLYQCVVEDSTTQAQIFLLLQEFHPRFFEITEI